MKVSAVPSMVQHMAAGRVRGIAITTLKRNAMLPEVPTVAEHFPGFQAKSWYGCWGPRGLPQAIVARWNREIARIVQTPAMQERMAAEGLEAVIAPPERLREQLREEVPKWARVVKAANIQPLQ
jgi:tripartite-type tricarboxylate transporter receptor subunit TctC